MEPNSALSNLRVLVVDDSAYNRQTITAMLEAMPGVEVAARAMNGKEALKLAFDLEPDVITLDLEMPEMDGFAFLRLLMRKRPTPVVVVSGYAQRENVFRALELGALDFIAKPSRNVSPDLRSIEQELAAKVGLVRKLQAVRLSERARSIRAQGNSSVADVAPRHAAPSAAGRPAALGIVGIAASTGGPPAIQQLLCALPTAIPLGFIVAQHMPPRFTQAFAERLDRLVDFHVAEAVDGHPVRAGVVLVAPGNSNVELEVPAGGDGPVVRVVPPVPARSGQAGIAPSADHLFKSLVAALGSRSCVLVLTGMGSDGQKGARVARDGGALVLAEDPATAVMPGMPYSVIETGAVDEVLALEDLPAAIVRFGESCRQGA